jgi:hypothetical protein
MNTDKKGKAGIVPCHMMSAGRPMQRKMRPTPFSLSVFIAFLICVHLCQNLSLSIKPADT